MKLFTFLVVIIFLFAGCQSVKTNNNAPSYPWEEHGKLNAQVGSRIIQHDDGTPFLWLGCTAWGMTEWLSREEVDLYLDDRKSKGMNVVQLCFFWGKRVDNPTKFTANAPNFYGFKPLAENNGFPDAKQSAVAEGGSPENPNDYWDHVDYCLKTIKERGMYAAVLPFWGRRYVNATHDGQSQHVFTMENIFEYGQFLGKRYGNEPHIIWVSGGDVRADHRGDYLPQYRLLAEGLLEGATGEKLKWDQPGEAWDKLFMTYHPDGSPMNNSSLWFHNDPWLDFNMIETYIHRDSIVKAVQQDLQLKNPKPTVLGEPHYEGITNNYLAEAINIRRQAYQSFFAGAAGFTYGGGFDKDGNGPLFSPANNWKPLLNMEGAGQLVHLKKFLEDHEWWNWELTDDLIVNGKGHGELEKLAVTSGEKVLVYCTDNSKFTLKQEHVEKMSWFNTKTGKSIPFAGEFQNEISPPDGWEDAVLILELKTI
tara:strand:- start:2508 stop:3944 length:1437 start_codon:yes stop_codon:yes gene_type:complete